MVRRFWAAAVDFLISYVLGIVVYCMLLSLWKNVRIMLGNEWEIDVRFMTVICLFLVTLFLVDFMYSVFFDLFFGGRTPGKRTAGYEVFRDGKTKKSQWILKHALFRAAASLLYLMAAPYYLVQGKMFYDGMLG